MLSADTFDLILTIGTTSRGNAIGGAIMTSMQLSVAIRRPLRATIALPADENGALVEAVVPGGTACVVVSDAAGRTWVSDWLTL